MLYFLKLVFIILEIYKKFLNRSSNISEMNLFNLNGAIQIVYAKLVS